MTVGELKTKLLGLEFAIKACKVVTVANLGLAVTNILARSWSELGLNIASTFLCVGSIYCFQEGIKMRSLNKEMKDMTVNLEADLWDLQYGKNPREQ